MPYHTNIMCLYGHNTPKNAHRLELFYIAFQYNPSSFTLFRLTWWQCVKCAPFSCQMCPGPDKKAPGKVVTARPPKRLAQLKLVKQGLRLIV